MTFALSYALNLSAWIVALVGVIWALAILNLDRWLITSTRRTKSRPGQIVNAIPRIALALILGFVISEPLVLRIFDTEVQDEIERIRQEDLATAREVQADGPTREKITENRARIADLQTESDDLAASVSFADVSADLDGEIDGLRSDIEGWEDETSEANRVWLDAVADANEELQVGGVSGRGAGAGPNYDLKLEKANNLEVVYNDTRRQNDVKILAAQIRIQELQTLIDQRRASTSSERDAALLRTQARQDEISTEITALEAANRSLDAQLEDDISRLQIEAETTGLLAQIEALGSLGDRRSEIKTAHYLLAAMFIMIDVLPVLGKLLQLMVSPKPYELAVDAVDARVRSNAQMLVDSAETAREEHLKSLSSDAEIRRELERENKEHFLRKAAEIQRRLGDRELAAWEARVTGGGEEAASRRKPPVERTADARSSSAAKSAPETRPRERRPTPAPAVTATSRPPSDDESIDLTAEDRARAIPPAASDRAGESPVGAGAGTELFDYEDGE